MQQHRTWYQETFELDIIKGAFHPTGTAGPKESQALQAQHGEVYDGEVPLKAELKARFYTGFLTILNTNKSVNKENYEMLRV